MDKYDIQAEFIRFTSCEVIELSIEEKLTLAYEIACNIGYSDGHMTVRPSEEYEAISDDVWMFIDGLYQQWFTKHKDGECSLKASLDFDMEKEEHHIDNHINVFYKTLMELK
jgi:hypothetical protein